MDARLGRHGEVFHLEADPIVVADHAHDGEELLPPLQVMTGANSDVVPGSVGHVIDALEFQQAIDVREPTLDSGVLAVAMVNRRPVDFDPFAKLSPIRCPGSDRYETG